MSFLQSGAGSKSSRRASGLESWSFNTRGPGAPHKVFKSAKTATPSKENSHFPAHKYIHISPKSPPALIYVWTNQHPNSSWCHLINNRSSTTIHQIRSSIGEKQVNSNNHGIMNIQESSKPFPNFSPAHWVFFSVAARSHWQKHNQRTSGDSLHVGASACK